MPCRTAILISGSGTNLQAFIDQVAAGSLNLDLCLVFSNKPEAFGLERAQKAGIPIACIEHGDFDDRESSDLLILAGFMRILSPWFVEHYEGKILNIHPALLPKYPGLNTHQRVLDAGDEWHGSTVHFVTEELDGGPRILAGRLRVDPQETPDELQQRVQTVEHRIYPQAAGLVGSGRVEFMNGETWIDGEIATSPIVETFD